MGPPKRAGLLAGGDHDGARIGQARGVGARRLGRLPGRLLGGEGRGDRRPIARVGRDARDRVTPGGRLRRIAGEGRRHLVEGVGDVEVEGPRPGEWASSTPMAGAPEAADRVDGDGEA